MFSVFLLAQSRRPVTGEKLFSVDFLHHNVTQITSTAEQMLHKIDCFGSLQTITPRGEQWTLGARFRFNKPRAGAISGSQWQTFLDGISQEVGEQEITELLTAEMLKVGRWLA